MSRLIDIDSLRGCAIIRPTSTEEIKHIEAYKGCINHNDIPTAYNTEAVVAELEGRLHFYENRFAEMGGTDRDVEDWGSIKSYKDAIAIVKAGGVE